MSVCTKCGITFRRWSVYGQVERDRCYRHHHEQDSQPSKRAVSRLRAAYGAPLAVPTVQPSRPSLSPDDRAERLRRRHENTEAWRTPLDPIESAEDALLAKLNLSDLDHIAA